MGYLPVILAMAAFVILWGIVSNNSIKTRKKEAEASASLVFEQASIRNEQLRHLHHLKPLSSEVQFLLKQTQDQREHAISSTDILLAAQKVSTAMPDLSVSDMDNQPHQEAHKQLQIAQENFQKAAGLFRIRLKQYNELVSKNPTKFIARLTGNKPVGKQ